MKGKSRVVVWKKVVTSRKTRAIKGKIHGFRSRNRVMQGRTAFIPRTTGTVVTRNSPLMRKNRTFNRRTHATAGIILGGYHYHSSGVCKCSPKKTDNKLFFSRINVAAIKIRCLRSKKNLFPVLRTFLEKNDSRIYPLISQHFRFFSLYSRYPIHV